MRFVLVALAAARLVVAGDSALDFLPAETKVVFGVRVSAIAESAVFKDAGTGAQKLSEDWLKLVAIMRFDQGFDPLHDIDEVLMASPADKENAAALLVLRGRFDVARMGAGAPRYHGVAMVGGGTGGKSVLALLDATTALAGDAAVVRTAIDRRGPGAAVGGRLDAQMAARVQSLRERFDIWGTGERPEGFVAPTGKREELDAIDRFEFGVRIRKGFELGAELHARSGKDAAKLAASMELIKAMVSGQGQAGPKIEVQVKEGTIKISVAISEEEVKKAIMSQMSQQASPQGARRPMTVSRTPVVVNSESSMPAAGSNSGETMVFVLPGKK